MEDQKRLSRESSYFCQKQWAMTGAPIIDDVPNYRDKKMIYFSLFFRERD